MHRIITYKSSVVRLLKRARLYTQYWIHVYPSSYPQPPNLCTEAVIDRVMITCMLAHWMKPRYNQSASSFQHLEGASGFFTMLTHSQAERQSCMDIAWISNVYWHNQPWSPNISLGTMDTTMMYIWIFLILMYCSLVLLSSAYCYGYILKSTLIDITKRP